MIKISSDFDHGNINCLDAANPSDIRLEIEEDGAAKVPPMVLLPS